MAIEVAGGPSKLAELLGTDRQSIAYWQRARVPAEWCPKIEKATGISRNKIRPDIYE